MPGRERRKSRGGEKAVAPTSPNSVQWLLLATESWLVIVEKTDFTSATRRMNTEMATTEMKARIKAY